jgi:hypothetical protein
MREGAPLTRANLKPQKESKFAQECERFAYQSSRGRKHQPSMRPRNLSSCSCGTPSKMGSTWLERRRKPGGRRAPEAGVNALAPLFPLPLSPLVCCWSRGMGSPCLFFPSQLFLSLRLLLHYSPHPAAFFLFLGTPAHPRGDVCTHLPHMAMATPILCSCFGLFTVLTCFLRLLLDRICWLLLVRFFNGVLVMHFYSSDGTRLWVWLLLLRSEWVLFFSCAVWLTDRQMCFFCFWRNCCTLVLVFIYVSLMIRLAASVEREKI